MFSDAKVGDRVWSFVLGWGKITDIDKQTTYPVKVKFKTFSDSFTFSGQTLITDTITLFWDEIKYEIPKKPKQKVKKWIAFFLTSKGNVMICGIGGGPSARPHLYDSKEAAEEQEGKYAHYFVEIEYEI